MADDDMLEWYNLSMEKPVLLLGKPVAASIHEEIRTVVAKERARGIEAGLALIIATDNPASRQYFLTTRAVSKKLGIRDFPFELPDTVSINELLRLIRGLNHDERISGVLVFLPLPGQINQRMALNAIAPEKDVDGLGAISIGRLAAEESTYQLFDKGNGDVTSFLPCTPYGVIRLLEHYGVGLRGKDAVIVGKSLTVGKSLALMMLAKGATVTVCHKETRDLASKTRAADVLCVAAGRPGLITEDMVKEGAAVIDVGINTLPDGTFAGDVDFPGVSKRAAFITPVPGGVGPVTIAILLKNTVMSARRMFGGTAPPSSPGLRI